MTHDFCFLMCHEKTRNYNKKLTILLLKLYDLQNTDIYVNRFWQIMIEMLKLSLYQIVFKLNVFLVLIAHFHWNFPLHESHKNVNLNLLLISPMKATIHNLREGYTLYICIYDEKIMSALCIIIKPLFV